MINEGVRPFLTSRLSLLNVITWGLAGPEGIEDTETTYMCRLDGARAEPCEYSIPNLASGNYY